MPMAAQLESRDDYPAVPRCLPSRASGRVSPVVSRTDQPPLAGPKKGAHVLYVLDPGKVSVAPDLLLWGSHPWPGAGLSHRSGLSLQPQLLRGLDRGASSPGGTKPQSLRGHAPRSRLIQASRPTCLALS